MPQFQSGTQIVGSERGTIRISGYIVTIFCRFPDTFTISLIFGEQVEIGLYLLGIFNEI